MMNRVVKKIILNVFKIPGIYHFTKRQKRGAIALFYHGVENEIINKYIQTIHFPFNQFEKQIRYLKNNFEIISLDYLYDCISNGYEISPSQVLITFDDGYRNNLNIVAPFLKTYNIPFSVFICTDNINTGKRFPVYYLHASIFYTEHKSIYIKCINRGFDMNTQEKRILVDATLLKIFKTMPRSRVDLTVEELIELIPHHRWLEINDIFSSDEPMNWDDIQELHSQGVTIGSHCHGHVILHSNQSNEEINYQLKTSKDFIGKYVGECKYFSYPNGGVNDISLNSINNVEKNKYLLGFTAVHGEIESKTNPYILPRIAGAEDLDIIKFDLNTRIRYKDTYYKWALNFSA